MKQSVIDQIRIGDYLIHKKVILVCTNVIDISQTEIPCYCFEYPLNGEYVGNDGPNIAIWDLPEMLKLKATRIGKDTIEAKNLEMLYGKV